MQYSPNLRKPRPPHVPHSSPPQSPATESIFSTDDYPPPGSFHTVWSSRSGYPISLTGLDRSTIGAKEDDSYTTSTRDSSDRPEKYSPISPDDDFVSFISSPTPTPMDQETTRLRDTMNPLDSSTDDLEDSRISVLGPKMRFVSRAPWEAGEEDLPEEADDEFIGASDALSVISGKFGGWKFREQEKASIKALAFAGLRSASPSAPSISNQHKSSMGQKFQEFESEDSVRSYVPEESPRGTRYAIFLLPNGVIVSNHCDASNTYESSPRSSLSGTESMPPYGAPSRPTKVSSRDRSPVPPGNNWSPGSFSRPFRGQAVSNRREQSPFRTPSPTASSHYFHPYANPDVVPTTGGPSPAPTTPRISHERLSDDYAMPSTMRPSSDSNSSSGRDLPSIRKASTPELRKLPSRSKLSSRDGGDNTRGFPITPSAVWPGSASFNDYNSSPMQNLISLEQAQARMRGQPTTKVQPSGSSMKIISPRGSTPTNPANISTPSLAEATPAGRQRTTSTGKRSASSGATTAESDGAPTKTLKHKRSAFMKIFGKDKDRDKDASTKDAPSMPDPIVRATSTPPRLARPETDIPPVPVLHIKRIPPPSLSVVVSSPAMPVMNGQPVIDSPTIPSSLAPSTEPSEAKASPLLKSDVVLGRLTLDAPSCARPGSSSAETCRPSASAPPSQTAFEGLSLRPVSSIFSAKFTDLLAPLSSPPPSTANGPSSSQDSLSPSTPMFDTSRSNSISTASDYPSTPMTGSSLPAVGPLSSVVMLQEQMANMRKLYQRQIWELEGQVRDLKGENEKLRNTGECDMCGQAKKDRLVRARTATVSVVDRPRPKATVGNTRTVFG